MQQIRNILLICLLSLSVFAKAQQESPDTINRLADDFVTASLIVVSPGEVLYSTLGHAALRLQCPTFNLDYVFSYESENVRDKIWTFLKGQLKMGLFAIPIDTFIDSYRAEGRGIYEYKLNLSPEQKLWLWEVMDNHLLEGPNQPYDYFNKGCAKSVVLVMHEVLGNNAIQYAPWDDKYKNNTQRELVRNFITNAPWEEAFMYCLIGSKGDKPCANEKKLIVPTDLVEVWQKAKVNDQQFLEDNASVLLPLEKKEQKKWLTPLLVSIILLFFVIICWIFNIKAIDYIVLAIQSALGLLMTYLIVFSSLPCTEWNWLIIPFNILPLICWHWRRYWLLPYSAINILWVVGMIISSLWFHVLVDESQIILALTVAIVFIKEWFHCKNYPLPFSFKKVGY